MQKLIIGVTARIHEDETNTYVRVHKQYLDNLTNRGMTPIILCPHLYEEILPLCDGFLVIGGDDLNPNLYNETNDEGLSKDIRDYLDELDKAVIKHATDTKKPLLGICRGIQSLAATNGKKLYQDIPSANLNHPHEGKFHNVLKVNNTPLASRLPQEFMVNTFHHQCVKELPEGFVTTFVNGDVIEGIEHTTLPQYGFQWHPERLNDNQTEIIFSYFKECVENFVNKKQN